MSEHETNQHHHANGTGCTIKPQPDNEELTRTIKEIGQTILVLSGKGGVGKSTVAVNLAVALAREGRKVGLLDVDIHGPSIPTMLGITEERVESFGSKLIPIRACGISVISIGLLMGNTDDALIWRGPMKAGVIRQFLSEVEWGELDYLIVDCPPGTGDEPLSVVQLLPENRHAVIVTTPQEVAAADVRKSLNFCRHLKLPVLGVIENMSGFACPHCGTVTGIFKSGGGRAMATTFGVPFLGTLPIDPAIASSGDDGLPFISNIPDSPTSRAITAMTRPILELIPEIRKEKNMKIAIPTANGKLCAHFGHCEVFTIMEVDQTAKTVIAQQEVTPPPHEPGVLPKWLGEQQVSVIIAGGMGQHAQTLFAQQGIAVVVGAQPDEPATLARAWMNNTLVSGVNSCDH